MPRKAEWPNRLDEALRQLRALTAPTIDRAGVEQLLGVSPRQALRILRRFSSRLVGKNLAIGRTELIAHLESFRAGEPVQQERRRLSRVAEEIERLRHRVQAKNIAVPIEQGGEFGLLPEGLRLAPGRLEITFSTGEDLLGKLLALAQAVAADPEQFLSSTSAPEP